MKKNKFYVIILMGIFLFSCNDWLDVDSDSRIVQEDLFSTGDGFRTAVNGIYRLLGKQELYAKDLTWGMVSVLAQNYDMTRLPGGYRDLEDYEDKEALKIIDPVWKEGYRVIANCNNLIQEAGKKDTSFFELGKIEKDLIIGEALGIRAMMHFDLLRLFAPAPIVDDGKLYIPYIYQYPEYQPKYLNVSAILDSVIQDLKTAKMMLAYHDTLFNYKGINTVGARMHMGTALINGGIFFSCRGTRMNYFAASALLARVYLYKGDKENAYKYAEAVYQFASRETWFKFTSSSNLGATDINKIYRKMYDDIILAAVNTNLYDIVKNANVSNRFFFYKNIDDLFEADLDDFRKTKLIETDNTSRRWAMPENADNSTVQNIITYQGPLAPIIRLSEIVYIMCEYLMNSDLPRAIELLEWVRTARGAKTPLNKTMSKEEFWNILYKEIIKESMSEGQSFFMYKRLNLPIYNGENPLDMSGRWVLPLPYDESAYINL